MNDLRSAPPRTAVPPGRLSWSKGATATVWTVRSRAVWENLMMTEVHRVTDRPQLDEHFLGTCWPVWGWAHTTRRELIPNPQRGANETVYDAWQRTADERVRALGGSLDVPVHQWPQAARAYAEGTWEPIFDVCAWSRTNALQCVMPRLDAAWVIDAVHTLAPRRAVRV